MEKTYFEKTVKFEDRLPFHYLSYLEERFSENIISDGESYIMGKKDNSSPVWFYSRDNAVGIASVLGNIYPREIITSSEMLGNISERFSKQLFINIYSGESVVSPIMRGSVITASEQHKSILNELITTMISESFMTDIKLSETSVFVSEAVENNNVFLLDDGGIRAMARIPYKTDRFARIDTIVTERESRGKGYVGELLSYLCNSLLYEGLQPIIFADSAYPPSNKAYKKLGLGLCRTLVKYISE